MPEGGAVANEETERTDPVEMDLVVPLEDGREDEVVLVGEKPNEVEPRLVRVAETGREWACGCCGSLGRVEVSSHRPVCPLPRLPALSLLGVPERRVGETKLLMGREGAGMLLAEGCLVG